MDVSSLVRQRLEALGLDQKDLAEAAQVTESYISQLLTRRKAPPAPARTDIYERISQFLKLPSGELARLAEVQRRSELAKLVIGPPQPLQGHFRELLLRKCDRERRAEVTRIFEKDSFGEIERLISQRILDATQALAREELRSSEWLHLLAGINGRSYEQIRVATLEFLDTDVLTMSSESCTLFLDPMIDAWDIDLGTFAIEIVLNPRLAPGRLMRYEFVEIDCAPSSSVEPGLDEFLKNPSLSGDITGEEIEFLASLRFAGRHPTPLYYYRELQSLRDPLHFTKAPGAE